MLFIADVHGAAAALARAAATGRRLVILGDLVNFIDYRTMDGILAQLLGHSWVERQVRLRGRDSGEAQAMWDEIPDSTRAELAHRADELFDRAYADVLQALEGRDAIVTFGNVDRIEPLQRHLPIGNQFVSHGVVEMHGWRVGIMGGGVKSSLRVRGELSEDEMRARLAELGEVEILATHVPPAVPPLATDVVGGTVKGSRAILEYLERYQPAYHYFGDIHQPQALQWQVGQTVCRNVGYFRATGRGVLHPARER